MYAAEYGFAPLLVTTDSFDGMQADDYAGWVYDRCGYPYDGILYLVIAQGKSLMLCNTYQAPDFTTAEYFIFMAMKELEASSGFIRV